MNPALWLHAIRYRRAMCSAQAAYGDSLRVLATLDIPYLRAGRLELMASAMERMSALESRDEITGAQAEAADVLRRIAASERGQILIDAGEGPGEHYGRWLALATARGHAERADALTALIETLPLSEITREMLAAVQDTEAGLVALDPPAVIPVTPGPLYRTELCRDAGGRWSLWHDGELLGRLTPAEARSITYFYTDHFPDAASVARKWASELITGREVTWLNGRIEPDEESGYWVAEPQDERARA